MIPIRSLFEGHLMVSDLQRSMTFFGDTLGLELAQVFPERKAAFYWIGGRGQSMLGLWEVGTVPLRMSVHLAFSVDLPELGQVQHTGGRKTEQIDWRIASRAGSVLPQTLAAHNLSNLMTCKSKKIVLTRDRPVDGIEVEHGVRTKADKAIGARSIRRQQAQDFGLSISHHE